MSKADERKKRREGGSEMKTLYTVIAVVAVIGIGVVGYTVGRGAMGSAASEPVDVPGLDDEATLVRMAQGIQRGDESAPFTIVEFADYQCPGCGGFALSVKPQIDLMLVETGKAKFVLYDFPLTMIHPNAFLAARAARCAGEQNRYWEYHDALFRNQSQWSAREKPVDLFVDYAEELGLDAEAFEACLRSDRYADVVTANMRLGEQLGVDGTPTIMVQGYGQLRRLGNNSYQAIEQAMAAIEAAANPGN